MTIAALTVGASNAFAAASNSLSKLPPLSCSNIITEPKLDLQLPRAGEASQVTVSPDGTIYAISTETRTDIFTEGLMRLWRLRPSEKTWSEISPFEKNKFGQYPASDIEFSLSPDGQILVAYFRASNTHHRLLVQAKDTQVVKNIGVAVGSPSRMKPNLGKLVWTTQNQKLTTLEYIANESLRRLEMRSTKINLSQNIKVNQLAEQLENVITLNTLPNLILMGNEAPSSFEYRIQNLPRVWVPDGKTGERESLYSDIFFSMGISDIYNLHYLIESHDTDFRLIAVVNRFSSQDPKNKNELFFYDNVYDAREAFVRGLNVDVSVFEFQIGRF